MATIRELQASFVARANGMKSTIQGVKKDIQGLATDTKKATKGMSESVQKSSSGMSKSFRDFSLKTSKSFEGIGKSVQTNAKQLEKWSKDTQKIGKSLTKRITVPALAAATALGTIPLVKGFQRLIGIDTARAKLMGLGHDAEGVELIMNSALDSVRGTSFGMGEAATTAAGAVAAGVKPGKELTKYLKTTGDAAAIAGASLGEMGSIVNKVQTSNKAYNDSLGQLSDRGLPIYQWIAKEAGVAEGAVFDMASKGEISSKMFLDAIEKNIGGAAGIIGAESFTAGMANMWAAVGRIGANFLDAGGKGGGFFSQLKPLMGEFTGQIDNMGDMAASAGVKFGKFFAGIIEKVRSLKKAYDGLSPAIQTLMNKVVIFGAVGAVAIGPLVLLFSSFLGIIAKILKPLGALFLGFSKVFGVIGEKGLGGAIRSLAGRFPLLSKAFTFLTGPVGIVIGLIVLLITTSKTLRDAIRDMVVSVIDFGKKLYKQVKPAIDTIVGSFKTMVKPLKDTGNSFDSIGAALTPLLSIIGALVKVIMSGLAVALRIVIPVISGVMRAIGPLVKSLSSLLAVIVNLGMAIISVFMLDFSKAMDYFKTAFRSVIDVFANLLLMVDEVIGDTVRKWINVFKEWFTGMRKGSAIFDNAMSAIANVFKFYMDYFKKIFSGWKAIFSGDFKKGAKIFKEAISELLDTSLKFIKNWFQAMPGLISKSLSSWKSAINKWFTEMKKEIPKRLNEWWTSISSWISGKYKSWGSALSPWTKAITGWFTRQRAVISKQLDSWGVVISKWFKSMPSAIVSTLKGWSKVVNKWAEEQNEENKKAFSKWKDTIVKWFESIPKVIKGNLKVWKSSIISWFIETRKSLSDGLKSWWVTIRDWFISIPARTTKNLNDWWKSISGWFVKSEKGWRTGLSGWWTSIGKWFSSVPKMLKEKLDHWWKTIKSWFANIGKKAEIVNAGRVMVSNMVEGAVEEQKSFIDKLGKVIVDVALAALAIAGIALIAVGREIIVRIIKGILGAGSIIRSASEWFVTDFITGLKTKLSLVKESGVVIASSLAAGVKNGINGIPGFFSNIGDWISKSIGTGMIGSVKSIVKGFFDSLKKSFESFGGILSLAAPTLVGAGAGLLGLTGPIGLVISVVMALVKVFKEFYQSNEGFRNVVQGTWEGIQKAFSAVWKSLEPMFDAFREAFSEIAEELGPEFAKTIKIISDSFNELKPVFKELGDNFVELGKTFVDLFKEIYLVAGDIVKDLVPLLVDVILVIVNSVLPMLMSIAQSVFPLILSLVSAILPIIVTLFTTLISVVMDLVKVVLPMILDVIKAVLPLVLSIIKLVIPVVISIVTMLIGVVLMLVKTVLPMILSVVKMVFPMILGIIKAVLPIVVDLITTLVTIVLQLVRIVIPLLLGIVKIVFPVIQKIIEVAMKVVVTVLKLLMSIIQNVLVPAIKSILKIVQVVFPVITKIIEFAMKIVVKVLGLLVKVIEKVVVPAIEFILKIVETVFPVIAKVIEGALNIVIGILDFFVSLFTGNWSGMWNAIKKILSSAVSIVWAVIKGAFDLIALFITTTFNLIASFFGMIWKKISDVFSSVIKWIFLFVISRFIALKDNVTTIFNAVKDFISLVWNIILAFFKVVIKSIVDFVKSRFENMKTNITTIFNAVKDFASKVWNTIKDNIVNPITSAVKTAIDKFLEFKKSVTDTFKNIKDDVFGYVSDMVQKVKDMPGNMKKGIEDMAYKVFDGMKSLANKMTEGLGKGVNGVIAGVNWVAGKLGVTSTIDDWTVPKYAHGTKGHPEDGLAWVGDGRGNNSGPELIQTPDGRQTLSPATDTLVDLPKGTQVLSAKNTRKYLESIPAYANGVGSVKDFFDKTKAVGKAAGKVVKKKAVKSAAKVAVKAFDVWDYVKDPAGLLNTALSTLGISSPDSTSTFGDIARGGFNKVKTSAVDYVKEKLAGFSDGGDGGGPVSFGNLRKTSSYGMRFHPIFKQWRLHAGDDYGGKVGTAIKATTGGRVTSSGPSGTGFGTMVKVKNGMYDYIYAHLSRAIAKIGSSVSKGDVIGALGNTGNSTGPHLHYEVRKGGRPVKPGAYKDGGIVDTKQLAWIADGGWAESIISHDPAKKTRQQKIWRQTGDSLGFSEGKDNKDILFELKRIVQAVESGGQHVVSAIKDKPILSEGDIKRSYDKRDSRESSKHGIFTGKPGGA